jgi:uncharacterized caspase-like protein/tetratricopeptide (TPR) repeat protein
MQAAMRQQIIGGLLATLVALSCLHAQEVRDRTIRFKEARLEDLQKPVSVPRGYAVVIGVGKYPNLPADKQLDYAESDAEAVARVLLSAEGGNIPPENLRKLIGRDATRERIADALENWLATTAKPEDRVIVYFAGHGVVTPAGGVLAPHDFELGRAAETGYPMQRLGDVLANKVKAQWKVLLTDACHSGRITPQSTDEAVYGTLSSMPRGFLTLTSSRQQERSHEDAKLAKGFGLFSYYLVEGWNGEADAEPRDGVITADELIHYVSREVRAHAIRVGVKQNPREHGDFPDDLILGYSAARRKQLTSPGAKELANGTLVVEANLDDVEIYVDDRLVGKVKKGETLSVPGLSPDVPHVVRGVRTGYEPVSREVVIVPGQTQTVTLRLIYLRKVKPTAQRLYDEGFEIYRRKRGAADWRQAEQLLAAALKEDSAFSLAALQLCRVRQNLGETDRAVAACRRAVEIDPDRSEARTQFGAMLLETGDGSEAVRQLSAAARQNPRDPFAHSLLAEAYLLAGSFAEANRAAERSEHAPGYFSRADARRYLKQWSPAIEDYQRYLELADFRAKAPESLAYYLVGFGASKRNAGFKRQHRIQQSSAYFGLCACELELENFQRAVGFCRKAVTLDGEDAFAQNLLGQAFMYLFERDQRRDDLRRAESALTVALRLAPQAEFAGRAQDNLKQVRAVMSQMR